MTQKTIKVIIAEDEPSCRTFLKNILSRHNNFEVIGEAADGEELLELAARVKPQVVFVDIEMPEIDGMSAVKRMLEKNEELVVVFVTGYSDFAVEAFEISSFDYILKPYKAPRVEKVLDKIQAHFAERENDLVKLSSIFKSSDKLYIRCGHELHFVDANTIYYVEKERKKTIIHTTGNRYETHEPINDLEKRLNPADFFRSHKCYLINLRMVEKIIPWGDNSYLVKFFNSNNDALISRSKVRLLYELLDIGSD
ncbi:MAG: LytTR family DNA-binding domain-containing protein [Eubacteriales bacterium]